MLRAGAVVNTQQKNNGRAMFVFAFLMVGREPVENKYPSNQNTFGFSTVCILTFYGMILVEPVEKKKNILGRSGPKKGYERNGQIKWLI